MDLQKFLATQLFDLPLLTYKNILLLVLGIIFIFLIRMIIMRVIFKQLVRLSGKTKTDIDDLIFKALKRPLGWMIIVLGVMFVFSLFDIPAPDLTGLSNAEQTAALTGHKETTGFISNVFLSFFMACLAWLLYSLTANISLYFERKAKETVTKMDDALIPFIRRSIKIFIVVLGSLLIMQNVGFDVAGLIAGLGIGGFAVALAAKDTISNVFGSATVFVDKAFQIDDWIKVGDIEGIVEDIGIRSTRIRKFSKSLMIIPNEKLASSAIENFSQRPFRRICESFKIVHNTTPDQFRKILGGIRQLIVDHPDISNDYYLVNFDKATDEGLVIFIYCFTTSADWKFYLNVKEDLLLKIMELLIKEGSRLARPSFIVNQGGETSV